MKYEAVIGKTEVNKTSGDIYFEKHNYPNHDPQYKIIIKKHNLMIMLVMYLDEKEMNLYDLRIP